VDDRWPDWAREQLRSAVALAGTVADRRRLALDLYQQWFACPAPDGRSRVSRPIVGEYRRAHAQVATRVVDGLPVLERHDRIDPVGWWHTWNTSWRPAASAARLLLSPRPDSASALVGELTARLRDVPYLLACPTQTSRLAYNGAAVLCLPRLRSLTPPLLTAIAPLLRADTPPLCLPVAPGMAIAQRPDNGMTFGEHRCQLVATALKTADDGSELAAIAEVFSAHGIDPASPYRTARGRT
jgi:hypothetical protein